MGLKENALLNRFASSVLTFGLLSGVLTSCDQKRSSSAKQVQEHFDQVNQKENNARTKIERHFKDSEYRFEISNVLVGGKLPEKRADAEDLTEFKFALMIWVEGAETLVEAEEVDRGLREIFSPREIEEMAVNYQTGMEGEIRIMSTLESMREMEEYLKKQGVPSSELN